VGLLVYAMHRLEAYLRIPGYNLGA
jgi:hypothetical protein